MNEDTKWNYYNLFQLFPNIKIIDTVVFDYHGSFNLPEIVKNNPQIKGLIGNFDFKNNVYDFANIEMFASDIIINNFDYKKVFRPDQLKQVHGLYIDMSDLPSFIKYFPNLKRLHLELCAADGVFYNGPNLSALKILELGTSDFIEKEFTGFHFMDFCTSLESAFIRTYFWAKDIYVNESIKNYNLRDLVIDNVSQSSSDKCF
ncbi:uncharacterized protein LOC128385824 [Panonychus citri]|uniref:uncharacterized protein LOC128385824 n=1 Tax=Panonychus citri TaxID=50023 RepID=UPI002307E7D0|nr:uncharacterized protein LOC128385824 [Panonychus citri]